MLVHNATDTFARGPAMTADPHTAPESREPLDANEGGGPPIGQPWTLVVESEGWSADLEHAAPLPRAGERIEYIGEGGDRRLYRVRDVVHTVQPTASERPPVRDEDTSPNATVSASHHPAHVPTELRAGLPRVYVDPET
jgi:hypothetical protein